MSIDWQAFDWQSFATLATGLAAVVGATIIGRRQTEIAERQAAIALGQNELLRKQTALAEVTLRHELFERRYVVYDAVRDFLVSIMRTADEPDGELTTRFIQGLNESRFLFGPAVHEGLAAIWERAGAFFLLKTTMRHLFETEGHYGDGNPAKEADLLKAFYDDLKGLIDLFGEEMRLSYEALVEV